VNRTLNVKCGSAEFSQALLLLVRSTLFNLPFLDAYPLMCTNLDVAVSAERANEIIRAMGSGSIADDDIGGTYQSPRDQPASTHRVFDAVNKTLCLLLDSAGRKACVDDFLLRSKSAQLSEGTHGTKTFVDGKGEGQTTHMHAASGTGVLLNVCVVPKSADAVSFVGSVTAQLQLFQVVHDRYYTKPATMASVSSTDAHTRCVGVFNETLKLPFRAVEIINPQKAASADDLA